MGAFCTLLGGADHAARADTPQTAEGPPARRWFTVDSGQDEGRFSLGLVATNMTLPRYGASGDSMSHRLVGIAAPPSSPWFYGGRAGLAVRSGSVVISLAQVSYMQNAGGTSLATRANGETVTVSRDAMHKLDVGIMGFGVQAVAPSGKAKLALQIDWGMAAVWSNVNVSGGTQAKTEGSVGDVHGFARLELAACGKTKLVLDGDSRSWGCLTVGTNLYEEGWFNGVAVGIRTDF